MPYPSSSPHTAPPAFNDEGEYLLYGFHGWLLSLAMDFKFGRKTRPDDVEKSLAYLDDKDPERARLVRGCLHLLSVMVEETTALLEHGIHWPTIEAMFCPEEAGFVDTPGHWIAIAHGQNHSQQPHEELCQGEEPLEPQPEPPLAEAPRRRASASALRSLGRSLRSELESEKRRFYAIARDYGLATDARAAPAMRAALSELLGEPIASRKQLTARQWGLAASSIQTEDLHWDAPPPCPRARPNGSAPAPRAQP